ncbi:MAG: N-acetyltransferase [Prevotella sp.]|jgi:GNAT superfamily N-acetyltransferase
MAVEIKKVESKRDLKAFIEFHYDHYKGNPYDVPSLYSDELNTLSKDRNAAFDFCEAEYYLAYKDGKLVGRVAAIINHRANERWNSKDVRFGWLEFIDDMEVSEALLEAASDYGRRKGMNSIVGPLGFTDMDPEGMLTSGFDKLGTMATLYNYEYYPRHMENLGGWEKDNDYVEYFLTVPDRVPEKLLKISKMVEERYHLRVKKVTPEDVKQGYARKLFEIINKTYVDLYGFVTLTDRQIDQYVDMFLPAVDFDLVTVIVDSSKDDMIVGIGITIPSLSKALQKCRRGRLFPFGWWHMLKAIKFHKTEGVDLLLIGVLPEYRSKGANALMFTDLIPRYIKYGFKWGESQVEMESNAGVQGQWSMFENEIHKRRRCYRKSLI